MPQSNDWYMKQPVLFFSLQRKKFMIESSFSGKKHTFITDTAKTCKYLLDLCSAQHKFNAQMNSRQLRQISSGEL